MNSKKDKYIIKMNDRKIILLSQGYLKNVLKINTEIINNEDLYIDNKNVYSEFDDNGYCLKHASGFNFLGTLHGESLSRYDYKFNDTLLTYDNKKQMKQIDIILNDKVISNYFIYYDDKGRISKLKEDNENWIREDIFYYKDNLLIHLKKFCEKTDIEGIKGYNTSYGSNEIIIYQKDLGFTDDDIDLLKNSYERNIINGVEQHSFSIKKNLSPDIIYRIKKMLYIYRNSYKVYCTAFNKYGYILGGKTPNKKLIYVENEEQLKNEIDKIEPKKTIMNSPSFDIYKYSKINTEYIDNQKYQEIFYFPQSELTYYSLGIYNWFRYKYLNDL